MEEILYCASIQCHVVKALNRRDVYSIRGSSLKLKTRGIVQLELKHRNYMSGGARINI